MPQCTEENVTTGNRRNAEYDATWRVGWAGSASIVLGLAFLVLDLLTARADLVIVTAAAGAAVGFGLLLVNEMTRRQRNMHASGLTRGTTRQPGKN